MAAGVPLVVVALSERYGASRGRVGTTWGVCPVCVAAAPDDGVGPDAAPGFADIFMPNCVLD